MTLGVCLPWQLAERDPAYYTRTLDALGNPPWINWQWRDGQMARNVPMVWQCKLGPRYTQALQVAQHAPRTTWLLGNEPERKDQSDTSPQEFVDAIKTWLTLVGGVWAGPGILWGDEGRAWIDEYLRLGGPVPTVWAIHIYGSNTVQGWLDQYAHALNWLADRGGWPSIWITETNGNEAIMRYLAIGPDDISAWWYCAHDTHAGMGYADLHDERGQLTHLGRVFAELRGIVTGERVPKKHHHYMPFLPGD